MIAQHIIHLTEFVTLAFAHTTNDITLNCGLELDCRTNNLLFIRHCTTSLSNNDFF